MIDTVSLREPAWLLLILLPLATGALARRARAAHRWADAALLPWAVRPEPQARLRRFILALAWGLLALAAAGPRQPLPGAAGQIATRGDVALMALVEGEAFDVARLELLELTARLRGERLGLVVYGRDAVLVTPPTADPAAFAFYLDQVPALADGGTDGLLPALDRAAAALPAEGPRALILLARGAVTPEAEAQAAALAQRGIALHTLALADDADLARLANAGGGRAAAAVAGERDWEQLYDGALARLDSTAHTQVPTWKELYPWALAPALALFLIALFPLGLFLPARALPLLLLGVLLVAPPAGADERSAFAAYHAGDFGRAQSEYAAVAGYAARMGEGASAYRRARFAHAVEQFRFAALIASDAPARADALYNLGNAALRAGDPALAVDAYEGALSLRGEARTRHNLALARARLAERREEPTQGVRPGRQVAEIGQGWDPAENEFPAEQEATSVSHRRGDGPTSIDAANARTPWQTTERDYRAGLKKLELLDDQTAQLLRGLADGEAAP